MKSFCFLNTSEIYFSLKQNILNEPLLCLIFIEAEEEYFEN